VPEGEYVIYVLLSALLFGLVHPGSKLILSSGMPLILFCLLYVGIRLVTQLPFVLIKGSYRITGEKNYILVLGLGFVGALLQVSEFAGISDGVNVSVVTFLVYSHPVWSMLISKFFSSDKWDKIDYIKLGLAVLGILFVLGPEKLFYFDIKLYWAPLCAGFLIAVR
jgi:drug/metabolite transporter (DMT)-like permease